MSPGSGKAKQDVSSLKRKHCQLLSDQVVFEEAIWNDGGSDGGRVGGRQERREVYLLSPLCLLFLTDHSSFYQALIPPCCQVAFCGQLLRK